MNFIDNMSDGKRTVVAGLLSFVVFVVYMMFFSPTVVETKKIDQNGSAPRLATKNQVITSVKKSDRKPIIVTFVQAKTRYKIDELGRIASAVFSDEKFKSKENIKGEIEIVNAKLPLPLEIRFADRTLNNKAFKIPYVVREKSDNKVVLEQDLGALTILKTIVFNEKGGYDLNIALSTPQTFFIYPGFKPSIEKGNFNQITVEGVLLQKTDETLEIVEVGDAEGTKIFSSVDIASVFDRYYASFLYSTTPFDAVIEAQENMPIVSLKFEESVNLKGYIGPKYYKIIKALSDKVDLTSVIEYGFFTIVSKPIFWLMNEIDKYVFNWGWAIIIVTLVVRAALFPLTYKSMVSMQKLKVLAPQMKELQQKYKDNPMKLQQQMANLYKKHKANPLGGCLPILLQIPVFFAMYRVFLNSIELKGSAWILWINDLSISDPYFILPLLMGGSMYLQQKLTVTAVQNEMQEQVMKWMPVIFTAFSLTFPAGLTLYWFISNCFSIAQQLLINAVFKKKEKGINAKNSR